MKGYLKSVDNCSLEGLEYAQRFANETGIDATDSRPCIARLFYEGMPEKSLGRKPGAFIIALELKVAGLPVVAISKQLEAFGGRCSPPLRKNILANVLRGVEKDIYEKRYSCDKLEAFCIGDMCPFKGKGGLNLSEGQKSSFTAFGALGWVAYLSGSAVKVFMTLINLRVKKGRDPDAMFTFDFGQLEASSGVSRSGLRKHLEKLRDVGLIEHLKIGTTWNSGTRLQTEVRLASPIPSPTKMGLVPLRAQDKDSL